MLAVPLLQKQIDAAWRYWSQGGQGWETREFAELKGAFPRPQDAVKVKAIVLDALYGTNVYGIVAVADRLRHLLTATHVTGPQMVEDFVADIKSITGRKNYVFVAKYAHFFVDPGFPILDHHAENMVHLHLGRAALSQKPGRYQRFVDDITKLKEEAALNCSWEQMDSYLWIAGEYRSWKKSHEAPTSGDLRSRFEQLERDPKTEQLLLDLLGISADAANA